MQSAIGRVLLRKVPEFVRKRQYLVSFLTQRLSGISALRVTKPPEHLAHSFYKYYVFVRPEQLKNGWDRQRIVDAINAEGVPCFVGSCSEIYLEGMFPDNLRPSRRLPVARELGETSMMFLVHPTLTEKDMNDTASAVERVFACATK